MERRFLILFLIFTVFPYVQATQLSEPKDEVFSAQEVRDNVIRFMHTVFGESLPTLNTYYHYEGHSESELTEELIHCMQHWNIAGTVNDLAKDLPTECRSWIGERHRREKETFSLYYWKLRRRFDSFPLDYKITDIRQEGFLYLIVVDVGEEKPKRIILEHIAAKKNQELGLIGIRRVEDCCNR